MMAFKFVVVFCFMAYVYGQEQVIVTAARGLDAIIPCGNENIENESVVMWTRNNKFLYSYTVEKYRTVTVVPTTDPTSLVITQVGSHDGGSYRCRVTREGTPVQNYDITLQIVGQAAKPIIRSAEGGNLTNGIANIILGGKMTLVCELDSPTRRPTRMWWERDGERLTPLMDEDINVGAITYHLSDVTQEDLDTQYDCYVHSADVTTPQSASVIIKTYFPATSINIRLKNDFEAQKERVIDCLVTDMFPSPTITWKLRGLVLKEHHSEFRPGNTTLSSLTWAPTLDDDKAQLVCEARNEFMPQVYLTSVALNVGIRPTLVTTKGKPEQEAEKSGKMTCKVTAQPAPTEFTWTLPDGTVYARHAWKIPDTKHRYISMLIASDNATPGLVTCRASNRFGVQERPCEYQVDGKGNIIRVQGSGRPQIQTQTMDENFTALIYATNSRGRNGKAVVGLSAGESTNNVHRTVIQDYGHLWLMFPGIAMMGVILVVYYGKCIGRQKAPTVLHPKDTPEIQMIERRAPQIVVTSDSSNDWMQAHSPPLRVLSVQELAMPKRTEDVRSYFV